MKKNEADFLNSFEKLAAEVHANNCAKGWWEKERNDYELIALMHSELSEATEALRHGNGPDNHIPGFKGTEAEFADVVIRIMDHANARGWNVAGAILAKVKYNATRPYRHGSKMA